MDRDISNQENLYIKKEQQSSKESEKYEYQYKTPNSKLDQTKNGQYEYNSLRFQKELKEKQSEQNILEDISKESSVVSTNYINNSSKERFSMHPALFLLMQLSSAFLGFILGMLIAFILFNSGAPKNTPQTNTSISVSQNIAGEK